MRTQLACAALLLAVSGVRAAEPAYPTKPVRIIVGFAPAGAADIAARVLGQRLAALWGQPVVTDNRPGAGSTIGSEIAAGATPDGHTLMVVSASYAASAGLYKKLAFDPVKSFMPITTLAAGHNLLAAHPTVPAKTAQELIAYAKANPGKLTLGSAGTGSITHLAGELFTLMAGIEVIHVPYKGGGPNLTALIGGEIQISVMSLPAAIGQVTTGRLKSLGITSLQRSAAVPDIPTVAESGLPGYEAKNWYGILTPAGTPRFVVARLHHQINDILRTPDMIAALVKQGLEAEGSTSEAFSVYLESEIAKWTKVVKAAGLQE
jgi:tripartite-type tricarboxylate transporter receptor subunit TctC